MELRDRWQRTALHWAVVNGHRGIVQRLIDAKASTKGKDERGETPLEIAERRAQCGNAALRPDGLGASAFGDIASLLGGSGKTNAALVQNTGKTKK